MRKQITASILVGLLGGSVMIAPGAMSQEAKAKPKPVTVVRVHAAPTTAKKAAERPLSDYQALGGTPNLFMPTVEAPIPVPQIKIPLPKPRQEDIVPKFDQQPFVSPAKSWTYTGHIRIDDQMVAILQNKETTEGQFLRVGDNFQGGTITAIDTDSVSITFSGHNETMAKSADYDVTPLSQGQQQVRPGQMPTRPGMGPGGMMPGMANNRNVPNAQDVRQRAEMLRQQWAARRANRGAGNMPFGGVMPGMMPGMGPGMMPGALPNTATTTTNSSARGYSPGRTSQ
jgi:hypothetical protein